MIKINNISQRLSPCKKNILHRHIYVKPITRNLVKTKVTPDLLSVLNNNIYFIGKGITLFTMFYCSMNWYHYRNLRIESEKKDDDKTKK